jgi:hypothetical protein
VNGRAAYEQKWWRAEGRTKLLISRPAANTIETLSVNSTIQSALEPVAARSNLPAFSWRSSQGCSLSRRQHRSYLTCGQFLMRLACDFRRHPHTICIRSKDLFTGSLAIEADDDGLDPTEEMAVLFEPNFAGSLAPRTGIELNICQRLSASTAARSGGEQPYAGRLGCVYRGGDRWLKLASVIEDDEIVSHHRAQPADQRFPHPESEQRN